MDGGWETNSLKSNKHLTLLKRKNKNKSLNFNFMGVGFPVIQQAQFSFFLLLRLLIWTRIVIQSKAINTLLQQKLHIMEGQDATQIKGNGRYVFSPVSFLLMTKSALRKDQFNSIHSILLFFFSIMGLIARMFLSGAIRNEGCVKSFFLVFICSFLEMTGIGL